MKRYALLIISLIFLVTHSCKKVDEANRYNQSLPTVNGGTSKTEYVTGDTLLLVGRLFYETGTLKIHIGNADGNIVAYSQSTVDYYGNKTVFDLVKIVLTPEMGVGKSIPVTITANGHTIDAAPINISKFIPVSGETDTTLFVEKTVTWAPSDLSLYQFTDTTIPSRPKVTVLPGVVRATVNPSGDISFFNPVGVFKVEAAQVTPVIQAGDVFTEHGQQFAIRYVAGQTNTPDPGIYYFSAEVLETGHDTKTSLVYRLCKFDATSGTVTTLNRSEVANFPDGSPVDPTPFQGDAAAVKVVAANLKAGANGDLFFYNYFPTTNTHSTMYRWYTSFTKQATNTGGHGNLCSFKDGKILSLFSDHNIIDGLGLQAPGTDFQAYTDYLLSPDGNMIMITNPPGGTLDKYQMYDLANNAPAYSIGDRAVKLKSFDDDPATKFRTSGATISVNYGFATAIPGLAVNFCLNGAIMPNGDLVFQYGNSLGSFNFLANNGYCYAGEENGFGGNASPLVTDTGKAKHVNFYGKMIFGMDKSLNFYFYQPDYSVSPGGVTFYKLYSKQ